MTQIRLAVFEKNLKTA